MLNRLPVPLLIAGVGLLILPPILLALGTVTSATEIVVFALACMALNILVGTPVSSRSAMAPGSALPPMRQR
jgi:branched-chain amino acid transport system ATP-binding protein